MKSGLWDQLAGSIIYAENVRQALQFAESGNASAAIVAWSLVLDRNATLIPEDLHSPILQSGGAVSSTRYRHQASNFLDLLLSPPGQALLAKFGYGPATPATSKKR
jgi:molybdate transport system substrate-binding protein